MTTKAIQEQKRNLAAKMRELHDLATREARSLTAAEQSAWDTMSAEFDGLEHTEKRTATLASLNQVDRRFVTDANGRQVDIARPTPGNPHDNSISSGTAWRDQSGREVRVYDRDERLAVSGQQDYQGVTFGGLVRSAVTGPRNDGERRALSEGSSSAGGVTVPDSVAREFIDLLRAKTCCIRAGARTVPMDSRTLTIAKLTGDVPANWRAENAALATGDPTFAPVTLEAKSLAGMVVCSRELLQDSINADSMLAQAFAGKLAVMVDAAALVGTGIAPMPAGLATISGVNQVSMGTNGAAITDFDDLMDLRLLLDEANASASTAWIMAPRTFRKLAGFTDTNGQWIQPPQYLYSNSWVGQSILEKGTNGNNPPWLVSTGVPITQTQGTASNASSIYTGDFTQMLLGIREDFRIEVLPQLYANEGKVAIVVHMRADVAVTRASDFGRLVGIIP